MIISFILIIWEYCNISYLLTTTSFKNKGQYFSGLDIPDIMMNIMSCHDFSKVTTSTVILVCRSALVPYNLSKVFIIVEKLEDVFENITKPVFKKIYASPLHE